MYARVISATLDSLSLETQGACKRLGWSNEISLTVGNVHRVWTIGIWGGATWLYVKDVSSQFPEPFPSECFEFDSVAVPPNWVVSTERLSNREYYFYLCPEDFAMPTFHAFYEALLNGREDAVSRFVSL